MGASGVNWVNVPHRSMVDQINGGAGVGPVNDTADSYRRIAAELRAADAQLGSALSANGASWEGAAATGMQQAATPLGVWADEVDEAASTTSTAADLFGEQFVDTRTSIPPVVSVPSGSWVDDTGLANLPGVTTDREAAEAAADAAQQEAARRMESYDNETHRTVRTQYFSEPPQVAIEVPPPSGGGQQIAGRTTGDPAPAGTAPAYAGGNPWTPPGQSPTPSPTNGGPPAPAPGHQPAPTPSQFVPGPGVPPGGPRPAPAPAPGGGGNPGSTVLPPPIPGGRYPGGPGGPGNPANPGAPRPAGPGAPGGPGGGPRPGVPGLPGAGGFGPRPGFAPGLGGGFGPGGFGALNGGPGGGFGPGGSPGGGFGPGGSGGSAFGGPGGGAGGPGAGAGAAGAPGAGAGPAGPSGAGAGGVAGGSGAAAGRGAGAGVGPMGGSGARGDDDTEHKRPDYLVETEDVWGDGARVAPAVIGERPGR